ncbi:MAG: hypothetical protein ACR2F6_19150 [Mycobacteriales bacterium]
MAELARAALPFAAFMTFASGLLLLINRPGTPEFVATVLALIVGLVLLALALGLHFFARRREGRYERPDPPAEQSASPRGGVQ